MSARFEDALYGWQIFRESGHLLPLAEINERLKAEGFRPVSARTFAHYHKLFRYGYEEYLPINQLDVKTLQDPVWDAAIRKRFAFRETSIEMELRLIEKNQLVVFRGLATRVSDAVVVIRFTSASAVNFFSDRKRLRNSAVELAFVQTGELVSGQLESTYIEMQRDVAVVRVSFADPALAEGLMSRRPLGERQLRVVFSPTSNQVYLGNVVQSMYWLFQGIESARVVSEDLLTTLDQDGAYGLPPSRVQRIHLSSPLEIDVVTNVPTIIITLGIVRALVALRKSFFEGSQARDSAKESKAGARLKAAQSDVTETIAQRLRWEAKQANLAGAIDTQPFVEQATVALRALLTEEGVEGGDAPPNKERLSNLIEGQLVPMMLALVESSGDAEITFEIQDPDE